MYMVSHRVAAILFAVALPEVIGSTLSPTANAAYAKDLRASDPVQFMKTRERRMGRCGSGFWGSLQIHLHPIRRPGRDTCAEKIGVLGPDGRAEGQSGGEDRPVVNVAPCKAWPRRELEHGIGFRVDRLHDVGQRVQNLESLYDGYPSLGQDGGQMFARFLKRGFRRKERKGPAISDKKRTNTRAQNGAYEDVCVKDQQLSAQPCRTSARL